MAFRAVGITRISVGPSMQHEQLTRTIIGGAMKVHRVLGPGYLESVYKNALTFELRARGLTVEREVRFQVRYEGAVMGDFSADMIVEGTVMVESKATRMLVAKNETQLVNYLTGTGVDIGLLLNFGSDKLQFRRKTRVYRPPSNRKKGRTTEDEPSKLDAENA